MAEPQNFPQEGKCLRYQYRQHTQPQQQNTKNSNISGCLVQMRLPMNQNPPLNQSYSQNQINIASASTDITSNAKTSRWKRVVPGDTSENMIDSKQKRMLKNREFAARSRKKKQAYKYELENKVSHLEEKNERLKKQKVKQCINLRLFGSLRRIEFFCCEENICGYFNLVGSPKFNTEDEMIQSYNFEELNSVKADIVAIKMMFLIILGLLVRVFSCIVILLTKYAVVMKMK